MSEQLIAVILDASTGEVIERDFTEEEVTEFESNKSSRLAEESARDSARSSALAKLAALGLTEEEIAAL
jgi:DNA-binding NarL/FixJ family response regulator